MICLLDVNFEIFTKMAINRLNLVAGYVVQSSQTTFMQGRNNLYGVVIFHVTVHEMHQKNL